jgi:glycosyltransferase involved in cell wall biosynthesis
MKSMNRLVSILIPCFNAERWIAQAIESALAQTWLQKEIIVVDDGSTDGSLQIIQRFDRHVRWESGPNRGGNVARNRLLELARGHWVQYLDADDYLLHDKIAQQMGFVEKHPDADVVFGPVTLEHWSAADVRRELLPIPVPYDLWVLLASWQLPQTGTMLWRKQAILDVGGWKDDQPCCQDHELYLRLLVGRKHFAYCATNGAVHRKWSTETVSQRDIAELHRRQLEIEQRLENYLRGNNQLTPERLQAINTTRFQIAQLAWRRSDSGLAHRIMDQIHELDPEFSPAMSPLRLYYRLIFSYLGFQAAERVSAVARKVARSLFPLRAL